jgi:hypothetical protein
MLVKFKKPSFDFVCKIMAYINEIECWRACTHRERERERETLFFLPWSRMICDHGKIYALQLELCSLLKSFYLQVFRKKTIWWDLLIFSMVVIVNIHPCYDVLVVVIIQVSGLMMLCEYFIREQTLNSYYLI